MSLSFTRLGFLFKLQIAENRKQYLFGLLGLIAIMAFALCFTGENPNSQAGVFTIGLFASASIFTSMLLSHFADKTMAVNALTLPVSALEKTIVAVVYGMIIFPALYVVLIYPIVLLVYWYRVEVQGDLCELFDYRNNHIAEILMLFFMAQAFTLFGSVMFRRFTLIKTAVLACAIFFSVFFINEVVTQMLFKNVDPAVMPAGFIPCHPDTITISQYKHLQGPNVKAAHDSLLSTGKKIVPSHQFNLINSHPFGALYFYSNNMERNAWPYIVEQLPAVQFCFWALFYAVIPLFWVLTYLRLKEKFLA